MIVCAAKHGPANVERWQRAVNVPAHTGPLPAQLSQRVQQ